MAGVYISYPFCTQKCSFCNFASGVSASGVRERYERVLIEQIKTHEWKWRADTIYFGGGTPSLMPLDVLGEILDSIPHIAAPEITLECAPGTLTHDRAAAWGKCGVNRISLGVQSFIAKELRETGRRHSAEIVRCDVDLLRSHEISNINVDLIAGLPKQNERSWRESLDCLEQLAVPHASVYIFEIDEESRLGKEVLLGGTRYGANQLPSDDLTAELYEIAVERLHEMGLARYEISNFARQGFESKHNLKYWHLEPYIGFGLDAHSFDGQYRWSTPDDLPTYLMPAGNSLRLTASDVAQERFFVGLRLDGGIQPTAEEWSRFAAPIAKWTEAGMLERNSDQLRLASRAVLVSNEILQDFVNV